MAKPIPGNPGERDRPQWLPRSAFPVLIRFADIEGRRIHYVDEGSGPALLLVSAGQWSFMFRDVIVRLREQFRCLTFDFPGSGLSPGEPGHDHSLEASARIREGFIDVLDLQDTMVVHDAGGPIGFIAATRFGRIFPRATAAGIADGHHFPFNDDPEAYSAAISTCERRRSRRPTAHLNLLRSQPE